MTLTDRGFRVVNVTIRVATILLALLVTSLVVHAANNNGKKALTPSNSSKPLGVRLQEQAGDGFEVIFDAKTGVYTVEPKGQAGITTK